MKDLRTRIYDGDNVMNITDIRYLPRWTVLLIDIIILILSTGASFLIYNKINRIIINGQYHLDAYQITAMIVSLNVFFMFIFRTYAGIIRHSTFIDLFKLLLASTCTILVSYAVNTLILMSSGIKLMPNLLLVVYFTVSFMVLFLFRFLVKEFFQVLKEYRRSSSKKRILVLGIDEQSVAIARAILDSPNLPFQVVGFLTQRFDSKHLKILGKPIFFRDKIENNTKETLGIDGVIINKDSMSREEMNFWVNLFLEKNLQILKSPSVQKLRESDMNFSIKNLQIDDLLNRKPIKIENHEIRKGITGKNILITGGAGSIGSEIVRQVAKLNPSLVVVLDQAETPLYDLDLEMKESFPNVNFKFMMIDITNYERLEQIFERYRFSMVYHAAAYKHVPLVEENPHEAIITNIFGSKNVALLSNMHKVDRFVMVSTDKAVNPTNVMGATKRVAELYVQSLQNLEGNKTKFITTRFGNVLGSNGSVIPLFKKQIETGGPITITHPEITRYFMTIQEACELVLQAGAMGIGGEVFVFDMGEPIKIIDLAKRMIKLSGFEPDMDIKIIYSGLRPGEKLYEELLTDSSKNLPTHHEKILISKDNAMNYTKINRLVNQLIDATSRDEKFEVVRILKGIVPEFKSNNSVYEVLD
ncbi:MAG: polysaccharide biosynthesis protein [Flavobacteriaceae bacterium]|nr:polysaccharide biosynthesis protein [Flavobacteriaceae bacterium]